MINKSHSFQIKYLWLKLLTQKPLILRVEEALTPKEMNYSDNIRATSGQKWPPALPAKWKVKDGYEGLF